MVIKYKCWDSIRKKWRIANPEKMASMFIADSKHVMRIVARPNFELLLWTGATDKNGVDIYSGDILDNTYYVKRNILRGAWELRDSNNSNLKFKSFGNTDVQFLAVTGNIYENPNWLTIDEE